MPTTLESAIAETMAKEFFNVVPRTYETYCPVVARIALQAFHHLEVPANLMACQLWHTASDSSHVIGFIGQTTPNKWDGHVICATNSVIVDAAVMGLHRDFALDVPTVAVVNRLGTPSQVIASCQLAGHNRLWWMNPPYAFDCTPPLQPVAIINEYARDIAARVQAALGRSGAGRSAA